MRRALKIAGLALLVVVALALGAVGVLTLTERGRANLAGMISEAASGPDMTVRLMNLDGIWGGRLRLGEVAVGDRDGTWLVVRGVEVDWSPFSLLSRRFVAERVHADRVEFARPPLPAENPPPPSNEPFSLPVTIEIAALDVPAVALGTPLAGEVAELSAAGSVFADGTPLAIDADLKLARTDGRDGTLDAKLAFVPDDDRLDVDVRGSEPAGGILATLLGLPGTPAVDVTVKGAGPLADWAGEGTFAVDGVVLTRVQARHREIDGARRIEAKGEGEFQRFVPEVARPLLSGETVFDVAGTLREGNVVELENATLETNTVRAMGSGRIDPQGRSDFVVDLSAIDAPVRIETGGTALSLSGASLSVEGEGRTPALLARAELSSLDAPGAEAGSVSVELRSTGFAIDTLTGPLSLSVTADGVALDNPAVAPLLAGRLGVSATADVGTELIAIADGVIDGEALEGTISGTISRVDGAIDLRLTADAASAALPPAARRGLGERVVIGARLLRPADGSLSVEDLTVSSGALQVAGTARIAGENLDARIEGTLNDLAPFLPQASGAATFTATAQGPLARPVVDLDVKGGAIEVAGRRIEGLEVAADGTVDLADPEATVTVKGTLQGLPLEGTARLVTDEGVSRIDDLSLSLAGNRIAGGFGLGDSYLPSGALELALPDIGPLAELGLGEITGAVTGKVDLTIEEGRPAITVDARVEQFTRGAVEGKGLSVDAVVSDYFSSPVINGRIRADEVVSGGTTVRDIDVELGREGPWTRFDGGATVAGIPATVKGRAQIAGETVTVELESAEAVLGQSKARLAEPSTIVVEGGVTRIDGLTVAADGGTASVSGMAGEQLALDVALDQVPAALANAFVPDLAAEGTLSGTAEVTGASSAPSIAFDLDLAGGGVAQTRAAGVGAADISATGTYAAPALSMETEIRVAGIVNPQARTGPAIIRLATEGFDVAGRAGTVRLRVETDGVVTANAIAVPLLEGPLTVSAEAEIAADAIRIANGVIDGAALDGTVAGTISRPDFGIDLQITADAAASALPAAARGALGERVAIEARVRRPADGSVAVEGLTVASGPLQASGNASLTDEGVDAAIEGSLTDLGLVAPQSSGAVRFALSAKGPLEAPQLDARITGDRIEAAGQAIEGLAFTASGVADLEQPEASVTLRGTVGGQPLDGRAVLASEAGTSRIDGLTLSLGENRISGDLTLDQAFVPEGALAIAMPDIAPLAALALQEATGRVDGSIVFSKDDGRPQVTVDATIAEFRRGEIVGRGIDIDAVVSNYLAAPAVSGRIRAEEVQSGGTAVRGIDIELSQDSDWTRFDGGATVAGVPARAAGRVRSADGVTTVELDSANATVQGIAARLARPSRIVVQDGVTRLETVALGIGGGTVEVTGTAGERLAIDARLSALPASAANAFSPGLGAEGAISGTASVRGAAASPDVRFDLDWANAATSQTRAAGVGGIDIAADGTYSGNRLTIRTNLSGGGGLALSGGGTVGIGGATPLDLSFDGRVPFSILSARLAAQGLALDGGADIALSIGGNASAPAISGTVRTSGARFVDAGSGLAVQDIAAEIALTRTQAELRSFTGRLSTGGSITGGGTVGLDPAQGFPANLSIRLTEGRYTDGRVVTANFSGDVTITGPLTAGAVIGGTVNLGRTVITIPERLPGSLARLDVKHRAAPAAVDRQTAALKPASTGGEGGGGGLRLDLTINAPQQIFVRGRGLDAEMGGTLRLEGPASAPEASGLFEMRRGRLSILGKRLDFTRGNLGFAGSLVPTLDFAATSSASNNTTVTVSVTGRANDPAFTFSSSPALPQDEILAQLIFGRSLSNLSPLQIAQLAEAAAQLTGIGGSTSLLDSLRDGLGVDDLDIKTDEATGDTAVSVGRYLNDRTYLSIEKGSAPGSGKARIDLEVGRGLKLRGEASDDGNARGGFFYEREY